MMKYALYSRQDDFSNMLCSRIRNALSRRSAFEYDGNQPELVICVGGDGTLLRAIHFYLHDLDHIYFVGIHTGTLGFFTDYTKDEYPFFLEDLCMGEFQEDTSCLLEITVFYNDGSQPKTVYALNEVRLGSFSKSVSYDIFIDGELFERSTGSGICISTQAGSTAISRALMGAVIDDGLEVLQLNEIMPISHHNHHSLRNPYIMRSDRVIQVTGQSFSWSDCSYDHLDLDIQEASRIQIRTSEKKVHFARFRPYSYLKRIKNLY